MNAEQGDRAALLVSAGLAAVAPVQVLLFSFLVLGPVHYLTEIAWLRRKQYYFTGAAVPAWAYAALAVGLAVATTCADVFRGRDVMLWATGGLLVLSLSIWVRNAVALLALGAMTLGMAFAVRTWLFFLTAMVPSLVHVVLFTWIFMVTGALRGRPRSPMRWLNPALVPVLAAALFLLPMQYRSPGAVWMRIEHATFLHLHQKLAADLHHASAFDGSMLDDRVVAGLFRVFGFVYLFHYLNWFVKTELLEWHRISKSGWQCWAGCTRRCWRCMRGTSRPEWLPRCS